MFRIMYYKEYHLYSNILTKNKLKSYLWIRRKENWVRVLRECSFITGGGGGGWVGRKVWGVRNFLNVGRGCTKKIAPHKGGLWKKGVYENLWPAKEGRSTKIFRNLLDFDPSPLRYYMNIPLLRNSLMHTLITHTHTTKSKYTQLTGWSYRL